MNIAAVRKFLLNCSVLILCYTSYDSFVVEYLIQIQIIHKSQTVQYKLKMDSFMTLDTI